MKTHTPGPWTYDGASTIRAAKDRKVCDVRGPGNKANAPESGREAEANAYLIAAAPAILSALRNAADVADQMLQQSGSAQAAFIRNEARAAIAKAEGRT